MTACVMVSPHLDDAALSASARLGRGGATVVTVFTAVPPAGWPTTRWDLLTGAASSRERQRERRAEDAAAMAMLGAHSVYLELPELLYRDGPPDLGPAAERLTGCFSRAEQVWLPAAISGHRDHLLARDLGMDAAARAGHTEVTLYADYPHVVSHGWPASVTGQAPEPFIDADFWLSDQLTRAGLSPSALKPEPAKLTTGQRARKREVIAAYRSQAPALRLGPRELSADPAKLDYELCWRMALNR
jgi:LmbE family N-acetylglucosaminyl deacetylase